MTTNEVCNACGRTLENHGDVRHPFSPKGASTSWLKPQKEQVSPAHVSVGGERIPTSMLAMQMPFDPVLRQALIAKGVVTPDELAAADKLIRSLGLGGGLSGSTQQEESPNR